LQNLQEKNKEHLTSDIEVSAEPTKYYDKYIEINLSELEPYINGPFSPDIATPVSQMKEVAEKNKWPVMLKLVLSVHVQIHPTKIFRVQHRLSKRIEFKTICKIRI